MNKKSVHGFVLVDKEKGVSSFFVLKQLKSRLAKQGIDVKKIKMGHAGTLDPLATGLLIVAVGEATKLLEYIVGQDKVYEAEAFLGAVTDTYDAEGEAVSTDFAGEVSYNVIKKVVQQFTGEIKQIPPRFSAKKIGGVAAYKLVRGGADVEMKECDIRIDKIDVISFKWPSLAMKVKCSSGTYIRSLIYDIGRVLGCGAYMSALRRVSIGDFEVGNAVKVDDFSVDDVVSIEDSFADFPTVDFSDEEMTILNRGNFVEAGDREVKLFGGEVRDDDVCQDDDVDQDGSVFLGRCNGKIFAVLEVCGDGSGMVKVKKKLNVFV